MNCQSGLYHKNLCKAHYQRLY